MHLAFPLQRRLAGKPIDDQRGWFFRSQRPPGVVGRAMACAVASALAVSPGRLPSARAAQPDASGVLKLEVLAVASNDSVDEAAALTEALKSVLAAAPGVAEVGKNHALEAVALTVGCDDPMTPSCAPRIAAEIKQDRFVYGVLKKTPPNRLTATIYYFHSGQTRSTAKTYEAGARARDPSSPELRRVAFDALGQLLGATLRSKVDVVVLGPAASESGDLYEGDVKIGRVEHGRGSVDVPAGTHTIELRLPGYSGTSGRVETGTTGATLQLSPVQLGGGKPTDWQLYGGIAAMGVGAAFIGIGIATSVSVRAAQDDSDLDAYRHRWGEEEKDTCARARDGIEASPRLVSEGKIVNPQPLAAKVADLCDRTSSKVKLQYVWYGLGGALLAGGAVLALTRDTGETRTARASGGAPISLRVAPAIGPTFASIALSARF